MQSLKKKKKKTITDPQSLWLRGPLKEFYYDNILSSDFKNCALFNQKNVIQNYDFFLKNKKTSSFDFFQILTTFIFTKFFSSKYDCKISL